MGPSTSSAKTVYALSRKGVEGRRAFITGAGGSIGREVATHLAAQGCALLLADHPSAESQLAETKLRCAEDIPPESIETILFDVSSDDDVNSTLAPALTASSVPTLVVNNAGIQGEFCPVTEVDMVSAQRVFDINVLGVLRVLSYMARAITTVGTGGSIVNIASMAGVNGAVNMAAYSSAKAAVIGLTKTAALDLAESNIRVNAVSPGFIGPGAMWDSQIAKQAETPSQYFADTADEVAGQMLASVPLRRYGALREVASTVAFLLSDDSSYITGSNLEIAGGAR